MARNESQDVLSNSGTNDTEHQVSCIHKFGYGIGHVLNDICASVWFTYLLVYFHLVLGFTPVLAGILLAIGQIADAVATPFVGYHSDKRDDYWLCRYGRRKTWHLTGTICVLLTFPFIFSQCIGCETSHQWAQLVYYAAFVVIFQFGWASVQISHLSLIPDLTPIDSERSFLTAIRYTFTVLSNVLIYLLAWGVLHVTNEGPSDAQIGPQDAHKFQKIVLIGMGIGLVSSFAFHLIVKEVNSIDETDRGTRKTSLIPPSDLFKDINLYKVALIYMPTRLFVNLTQTYMPLYLHETLKMPATALALIPLVMYLSSFKASITINYLNKIMGRKMTYFIGTMLGVGACTWIWFGRGDTYRELFIYPVSLLIGSGGSFMLVTSLSITADYIGHGTENGAFVYGIMSFVDKLFNGIAVMIIQYLRCDKDCAYYYKDVLAFVCGGAALVGFLMTLLTKSFRSDDRPNIEYSNVEGGDTVPNTR